MTRVVMVVGAVLALVGMTQAEVKLPAVISSGMVLQRERAVPIWGWADAGEAVTVKIAGQSHSARAGEDGRWQVTLEPLEAGGPHRMTVGAAGADDVVLEDILVGEVWLCSGQSNMEWSIQRSDGAEEAQASADRPTLRLFKVERATADQPQQDLTGQWAPSSAETIQDFSAVGYYFGRKLHEELDVPVGLIHSSWGGTPAEAWMSWDALLGDAQFEAIVERDEQWRASAPQDQEKLEQALAEWERAAAAAKSAGEKPPARPPVPESLAAHRHPAKLYNAMIAPLAPYGLAGAIWYQGESNATRAQQYRALLPALIGDWRRAFAHESMPFGIVQLANFHAEQTEPAPQSHWAELREAQLLTAQKLKNVGLAVIIDIGDAKDIHPRNKLDVGQRLARWALAKVYGRDIVYSGPVYRDMRVDGSRIVLQFDHVDGGLVPRDGEGKQLNGFAIAGEDRNFVWADAKIEGDRVVIWSEKVPAPVAVRYSWADNPIGNLNNAEGLPATPFRTDDWPMATAGQR